MQVAQKMPDIKVQLERTGYYPGQRVTGVVTLHVTRPMRLRGLRVRLTGSERVLVRSNRQTRWTSAASVDQEIVLAGRERLPDMGAVVVDTWDTLLQRSAHTNLLPGEYIYPFSVPLPGYVPPTYQSKSVRVEYNLQVVIDRPLGSMQVSSTPVRVFPPGRQSTARPLSLSIKQPEDGDAGVTVGLSLEQQEFSSGGTITGRYQISNPQGEMLECLYVSLKAHEEITAPGGSASEQRDAAMEKIPFADTTATAQNGEFRLQLPQDIVPSVSGRTFALTYSLEIRLSAPRSSDLVLRAAVEIVPPPILE